MNDYFYVLIKNEITKIHLILLYKKMFVYDQNFINLIIWKFSESS